jgi:hypothetical protein
MLVGPMVVNINKKGAVRFEPPPKDVPSKMPLLIFLPEKCTNIPEVNGKNKTIFWKFKVV